MQRVDGVTQSVVDHGPSSDAGSFWVFHVVECLRINNLQRLCGRGFVGMSVRPPWMQDGTGIRSRSPVIEAEESWLV